MKLRSDDLVWREVDGETVVLDLRESAYFRLNRSGTVLLQPLQDGTTRDELVELLVSNYGIDADRAGAEVDAFVAMLAKKGLIT